MKKGLKNLGLGVLAAFALVGCTTTGSSASSSGTSDIKVGLICVEGEESTYDKNFIDSFQAAAEEEGVTAIVKTGIGESNDAYEAAADLVDQGCSFIFADSFGHESYILKAAKEFTDVQFAHATGTMAHTENLSNFHNAFASIYEGRYLAGVAAGLKLQAMIDADSTTQHKLGYVGAYTYAEVISGYTAFYLGAKSIVSDVTMDVTFTGSWYDEAGEKSAAESLINNGAAIISQHADSWGAPTACENAGVPNVTYNGSTESKCPNTYLISSKINWTPYFKYAFEAIKNGTTIDTDWSGELGTTLYDGSVALDTPGAICAVSGTEDKLNEVATELRNSTLKVFDCSTFTVTKSDTANVNATVDSDGHLTAYMADVDTDANYTGDTDVIKTENGITYFDESTYRSAPYFDVQIDGITLLNSAF